MDNDKKIIKSPYYSPEDLEKYSKLLQRGLQDLNISSTDPEVSKLYEQVQEFSRLVLSVIENRVKKVLSQLAPDKEFKLEKLFAEIMSIYFCMIESFVILPLFGEEKGENLIVGFRILVITKFFEEYYKDFQNSKVMEDMFLDNLNKCDKLYCKISFDFENMETFQNFFDNIAKVVGDRITPVNETIVASEIFSDLEEVKKFIDENIIIYNIELLQEIMGTVDIKEYPELAKRLEDRKKLESKISPDIERMSKAVQDHIEKATERDKETIEMMNKLWNNFKDFPNNEETLRGKAMTLAIFVLLNINSKYEWFLGLRSTKTLDKETDELFLQITSLYISTVDIMISKFLKNESLTIFLDIFHVEIIDSIRRAHSGNEAQKNTYIYNLEKLLESYSKLEHFGNAHQKDSSLWKFVKNIEKIIGKENDPFFKAIFYHQFIRDIFNLQVDKLLTN